MYRGVGVWVSPVDTWRLYLDNGSGNTALNGPAVRFGEWTHVAWSYDGSTVKLYINGTLAASATAAFSANTSAPFSLGMWSSDNTNWYDPYAGLIDDVSLYSSALTAAQIRTHYNTGRCYKDGVLADGPLGYWRLGEGAGITAADGIAGRHGTYVNGPTLNQSGALNGDANPAVTFNGTNNRVTVPNDAALNPAQVTVEAWAKPTGGAGTNRAIADSFYDDGAGAVRGFFLGIDGSGRWWLALGNGTSYNGTAGGAATLNTWTHLVGTFDGTTARLYVDGVLAGSAAASYAANAVQPLTMGAWPYLGSWVDQFTGSIDEVAVYGSALSQARIQAHYLLGRSYKDTILDSAPVSYWRLGESSGASAADSAGGNTGTYTNGPTLAQPGALGGDADTAATFNGTTQYVTRAYTVALNPAQFTVEAWVEPNGGQNTWRTLVGSWASSGGNNTGYWLGISGDDNTWRWQIATGSGYNEVLGSGVTLNTWTHVVGTYDGSTARLYLNGTSVGSVTTTYGANATKPTVIGAYLPSGASYQMFLPGLIDDVAIYNTALTAAQIQLHHDSGRQ